MYTSKNAANILPPLFLQQVRMNLKFTAARKFMPFSCLSPITLAHTHARIALPEFFSNFNQTFVLARPSRNVWSIKDFWALRGKVPVQVCASHKSCRCGPLKLSSCSFHRNKVGPGSSANINHGTSKPPNPQTNIFPVRLVAILKRSHQNAGLHLS